MKVKWIGISTISLLLIGMGLSILGEAIILKVQLIEKNLIKK